MSLSRFIRPDDPAWGEVLSNCKHDLYHLPEYSELEGNWNNAQSLAFLYQQDGQSMLLPLLERSTPSGMGTDAVTPYGYSSPVFTTNSQGTFIAEAFRAFQNSAKARGLISTFIRLHPMICPELPDMDLGNNMKWFQINRGSTVTMPMSHDRNIWLRELASGHRAGIRKLIGSGCTFELDTNRAWSAFPEIYRATMERVSARETYFYSNEYIERFRQKLGQSTHCAAVIDSEANVMAAGLFTLVSDILQYHLSGTAERFLKMGPMKLLLSGVRDWAFSNGITRFHLGGGVGGKIDSLFAFKEQFGGDSLNFRTVSIIHDIHKFDSECEAWKMRSSHSLPGPDGFFPPYRAPIFTHEGSE